MDGLASPPAPESAPATSQSAAQQSPAETADAAPLRATQISFPFAATVLLIVAILTDEQLQKFHSLAVESGLSVLVEVHDEAELNRALNFSPALIGVNNRDLKTFKVDLANTERLAPRITTSALLVAESGIHTRADVERLKKCGAKAILVGESLLRGGDIQGKVRQLLGRAE